jgi:hypothetical protein
MKHVNEALNLLGKAVLSLKLIKCHFFKEAVDYHGPFICPGKLAVAEKNTAELRNAPVPKTQTVLRCFFGLFNVYCRFVPRFAAVAAPLKSLLGKRYVSSAWSFFCAANRSVQLFKRQITGTHGASSTPANGKTVAGYRRVGRPIGKIIFTGTTRWANVTLRILVPDPEPGRKKLLYYRERVPRHRIGIDAPKALPRMKYFYRANVPSCPSMGNESIGCSRPPSAVAVTPCRVRLQSGIQPRLGAPCG